MDKIIQWNNWHALVMFLASICTIFSGRLDILYFVALSSFVVYIVRCSSEVHSFKPVGGYCNWITLSRLVLIGTFCVFISGDAHEFTWLCLLILTATLDGVDGFLARKFDQSSAFGEYFDLEVDALFVLAVSFYFYLFTEVGAWILIPAFLRYIYKFARILAVKKDYREAKSKLATYIAGYYFTVLILSMILKDDLRIYALMSGALLVSISFLISYYQFFTYKSIHSSVSN